MKKNKHIRFIVIFTFLIILGLPYSTPIFSDIYKYQNNRVQKSKSNKNKPLKPAILSEIAYQQDEKEAQLRAQLLKSQAEQRRLRKELDELRESFKRFKNYYFRRY